MTLGDLSTEVEFGMASGVADFFTGKNIDGIFGLAYQAIAQNKVEPPLKTLHRKGLIDNYAYSMYLTNESTSGSQLILGGLDES